MVGGGGLIFYLWHTEAQVYGVGVSRGVWGHVSPRKFWKVRHSEMMHSGTNFNTAYNENHHRPVKYSLRMVDG